MQEIFAKVGKKYGYEEVEVEFAAFRDFKLKWGRSHRWITFAVSDYLEDAPENVLEGIANTIFAKIKGEDASYPEDVVAWLTSSKFVEEHQPRYIGRCRGLSKDCTGRNHNLCKAYERLVARGLVEYDCEIAFRWGATNGSMGRSSTLMKTVVISDKLDSEDVTEEWVDYALYTQLMHIGMGFNASGESRGDTYNALLDQFPDRDAVEGEIRDKLGLKL